MSGLALMEVTRALIAKLQADGVLMGMVTGIYNTVPQRIALPYVMVGDGVSEIIPSDNTTLSECRLEIDIWTDAKGRKSALTIMNRLHALLHLGTLTLTGYQLVLLRCDQAQTTLEENATHVHGTLNVIVTVAE